MLWPIMSASGPLWSDHGPGVHASEWCGLCIPRHLSKAGHAVDRGMGVWPCMKGALCARCLALGYTCVHGHFNAKQHWVVEGDQQ